MILPVEVPARVPGAPSLLVVHADGDVAVEVDEAAVERGVGVAALGLTPLARAALVLAADLQTVVQGRARVGGQGGGRGKEKDRYKACFLAAEN